MSKLSACAIVAGLSLMIGATTAGAVPVTIDFTSGSGNNNVGYDEAGFRFRAESGDHYENQDASFPSAFSWHDSTANVSPNIITVDFADGSGNPFAVIEVDVVNIPTNQGATGGIRFFDSVGGSVVATTTGTVALNFLNTTFLKFQIVNTGVNSFPITIDNLDLDTQPLSGPGGVPEPTSLVLLGISLFGLAAARRIRGTS